MTVQTSSFHWPGDLVPHKPPMLLVDEVIAHSADGIVTRTQVTEDNPFFMPGRGLPSYVTFEIMAQSISAHDGESRRLEGLGPAIGLLLGCRKFTVTRDWLHAGESLETEAVPLLHDGELRSFECVVLTAAGAEVSRGAINVFRPSDPDAYFEEISNRHAS